MIICFDTPSPHGHHVMQNFAAGCDESELIFPTHENVHNLLDDFAVWGILRGTNMAIQHNSHLNHYYLDNGYYDKEKYYRCTLNSMQARGIKKRPKNRLNPNIKFDKWKKGGSHIIVAPPTDSMTRILGVKNWLDKTLTTLEQNTDRKIIVRHKPNQKRSERDNHNFFYPKGQTISYNYDTSLYELFDDAYAFVTYQSNTAFHALQKGIPVFCEPVSACAAVGEIDYENIEKPNYSTRRMDWLAHISYSQFTLDEMRSGFAMAKTKENFKV